MKKLIMFDFDGTLVDSQILYDISASKSLSKINPKYTPDFCIEYFNGRGWKDVFSEIGKLEPQTNIKQALDEALEMAKALTLSNISTVKNATNTIQKLTNEGYLMTICSNSKHQTILEHLKIVGLDGFFEKSAIFGLESVEKGKPAPDVYLKSLKYFNVKKHESIIIEDSLAGIKSGLLAGIDTLLYKGGSHHTKNPKNTQNVLASLKNLENNTLKGEINDLLEIFNYLK